MSSLKPMAAPAGGRAPIAVIGMASRAPVTGDRSAVDRRPITSRDVVRQRVRGFVSDLDPDAPADGPKGVAVDLRERFDADFFGIRSAEAAGLDLCEGTALELAWHACEDAGILPGTLRGTETIVIAAAAGAEARIAARIADRYGLVDPGASPDITRMSSLVAVQRACERLRRGQAQLALAGGVLLLPTDGGSASEAGSAPEAGSVPAGERAIESPSRATMNASGALFVLKPLAAALASGDRIRGVVLGGAISHLALGRLAVRDAERVQSTLVRDALADAGVDLEDLGFAELQGPLLADRSEVSGLAIAMADRADPLPIGSVAATHPGLAGLAGVFGLVRTLLGIEQGFISAHPELLVGGLPLRSSGLRVPSRAETWLPSTPRYAGIGAFGSGDTQCQLIIGPPPNLRPVLGPAPLRSPGSAAAKVPWLLSARSPTSLRAQAAILAGELGTDDRPDGIRETLRRHRTALPVRAAVLSDDPCAALYALAAEKPHPDVVSGTAHQGSTAFTFPACDLRGGQPRIPLVSGSAAFGETFRSCARALLDAGDDALADFATHDRGALVADSIWVGADSIGPVWWAVTVAVAAVWQEAGIRPVVVIGAGIGEIAAATFAGLISVRDGARIARALCAADRAIAQIGRSAARERLRAELETVSAAAGPIGFVSMRTGCEHPGNELTVEHWVDSLGVPDRTTEALLMATTRHGLGRLLECGTQPRSAELSVATPAGFTGGADLPADAVGPHRESPAPATVALGTMDGAECSVADVRRALASAWTSGAEVAWTPASCAASGQLPGLPGYPFERRRYSSGARPATVGAGSPDHRRARRLAGESSSPVGPAFPDRILWPLSAGTAEALRDHAGRSAAIAQAAPDLLAAAARQIPPDALMHRAVVIAQDRTELLDALRALAQGADHPAAVRGVVGAAVQPVLVFPGTDAVWSGITAGLVESSSGYWESISRCDGMLAPLIDWSVLDVVRGEADAPAVTDPVVSEVTRFATSVALASLWRAVGVHPTAVLGRQSGELAAAHDARIVELGPSVAAVVGAAGPSAGKLLDVPVGPAFGALEPRPGRSTLHSSTLGREVATATLTGEYFRHALGRSNRFIDAVIGLASSGGVVPVFIEVSAHPTVVDTIHTALAGAGLEGHAIATLRRGEHDVSAFVRAAAAAWVRGIDIDWTNGLADITSGTLG